MDNNGQQLATMENNGQLWTTMDNNKQQWKKQSKVLHASLKCFISVYIAVLILYSSDDSEI